MKGPFPNQSSKQKRTLNLSYPNPYRKLPPMTLDASPKLEMTAYNPDNLKLGTLLRTHLGHPHLSSYSDIIIFLQSFSFSSQYLHHLAGRAQFFISKFPKPETPATLGLITSLYLIICIFHSSYFRIYLPIKIHSECNPISLSLLLASCIKTCNTLEDWIRMI